MYLLGYDIGTSSVKASIVDSESGRCVATDFFPKVEAPIKALHQGWAEQNPENWWQYLKDVTASVLSISKVNPKDIKAIGFSFQMHGLVCIDKEGKLLRNAIIWCDSRAVPYGEKAFNALGADLCLSHLLNSPGNFTAAKLAWVKENEPEVFEKIYKVMLPADYIAMKMTGVICTTPEGLSNYVLWDFKENAPAKFLMDYFGFDMSILPEVRPTFSNQGELTESAAAELGLAAGTPVTYRAGDQPNNALSLTVFNPGEIAATAGTSGVVYAINGKVDCDPKSRVNCFAHVNHTAEAPRIGVLTCINGTGILNSWMKRNIAQEGMSYDDMNRLAQSVPVGAEGVSIIPFGNGAERILQNKEIGCSMHGINFNIHDRRHLLPALKPLLEKGEKTELCRDVRNVDRTVGTELSGELVMKFGPRGLAEDTLTVHFTGCAGQSFGAFLAPGVTFELVGEANDFVGKGLSGGKIIVRPPDHISYVPSDNVIAGNVIGYGATSGGIFLHGQAGERFAIRNSLSLIHI